MTDAEIALWGRVIGGVSWNTERGFGVFQYHPAFLEAEVEPAPFTMPRRAEPYRFPVLRKEAFRGLPGLVADALPDQFGHRLIDAWLVKTGQVPWKFDPVSRLRYIGRRGAGALEFRPLLGDGGRDCTLDVARLAGLAQRILDGRAQRDGGSVDLGDEAEFEEILSVGAFAGGSRAKAVLAWNPETGEFRSSRGDAGEGVEHWILKFDGLSNNSREKSGHAPRSGQVEYAYHLMARGAGVEMADCRLHSEGGCHHFMTRRFDRGIRGGKIHMQSLAALRHYDLNETRSYAYEQVMQTIRGLGLGQPAVEEQFRRTIFNVMACNQDDHVKNVSFLMNQSGAWSLSPAYDVTYAYNSSGLWAREHQMSMAGKRDDFEREDIFRFAKSSGVKKPVAQRILDQVTASVWDWTTWGEAAGLDEETVIRIGQAHRLRLGI